MPTREQIADAWLNDLNPRFVEYKLSYFKTPTKKEPRHHWTFQWTHIYSLPEVRKKAMYMINRGMVSPNSKTYYSMVTDISYWVEVSKDTSSTSGEKMVGILVKSGDDFYWKGAKTGGYHKVLPNGSISSKGADVRLPTSKVIKGRS